ncbi:MAG: hypothetical protein QME54_06605 [Actinomycetota bacterium]|nr:hypothetical protein [Actinomycetota bacterium]
MRKQRHDVEIFRGIVRGYGDFLDIIGEGIKPSTVGLKSERESTGIEK